MGALHQIRFQEGLNGYYNTNDTLWKRLTHIHVSVTVSRKCTEVCSYLLNLTNLAKTRSKLHGLYIFNLFLDEHEQ